VWIAANGLGSCWSCKTQLWYQESVYLDLRLWNRLSLRFGNHLAGISEVSVILGLSRLCAVTGRGLLGLQHLSFISSLHTRKSPSAGAGEKSRLAGRAFPFGFMTELFEFPAEPFAYFPGSFSSADGHVLTQSPGSLAQ